MWNNVQASAALCVAERERHGEKGLEKGQEKLDVSCLRNIGKKLAEWTEVQNSIQAVGPESLQFMVLSPSHAFFFFKTVIGY